MTRIAVVANGAKLDRSTARELLAALEHHGHGDVPWYSIERGSDATKAAAKAVRRGAEVVVVCGGDGTVRAASQSIVGTDAHLAVVPAGTANLFATGLHLPTTPAAVIDAVADGATIVLDSGTCNGRTFNVMAGSGFDAAMIADADDAKERWGTLAYVRSGVREARRREPFQASVKVDGEVLYDGAATCVLVANIGSLKAGIEAFPDASPTDGRLDIAVITASGPTQWARLMVSAVRGRQQWNGTAHFGQGRKVSVDFDERHRFELDGGCKGKADRLQFRIKPASLRVCTTPPSGQG